MERCYYNLVQHSEKHFVRYHYILLKNLYINLVVRYYKNLVSQKQDVGDGYPYIHLENYSAFVNSSDNTIPLNAISPVAHLTTQPVSLLNHIHMLCTTNLSCKIGWLAFRESLRLALIQQRRYRRTNPDWKINITRRGRSRKRKRQASYSFGMVRKSRSTESNVWVR